MGFDELIFASGIGAAVAFVVAIAQIFRLDKRLSRLQVAEPGTKTWDSDATSREPTCRSTKEIERAIESLNHAANPSPAPISRLDDRAIVEARERRMTIETLQWVLGAEPEEQSPLCNIET